MNCPKCAHKCLRDEVDVEVGIIYGPYGCPYCRWSEWKEYDFSDGQSPITNNGILDQYGNLIPFGHEED